MLVSGKPAYLAYSYTLETSILGALATVRARGQHAILDLLELRGEQLLPEEYEWPRSDA